MYAKLFSRITESSLMEEPINVRYVFVMMLAISDPKGYVIGTDVAIARRLNMPTNEFQRCADVLMQPDEDSNSKEEEGRRILQSDGERGYKIVNYLTYRDMQDQEQRREYMRNYMQKRRANKRVNSVNNGKLRLTHAEAEAEEKAEAEETTSKESAMRTVRVSAEEKDRLMREVVQIPPNAPSDRELAEIIFRFPVVKKWRSDMFWHLKGNKFHVWKRNRWEPIKSIPRFLDGLEKKFIKQGKTA